MKIGKKLSTAVIAVAMCMLLVVTVWAVNVTYSATLDDSVLCANEVEQTVTLTAKVDEKVAMDSFTAQVRVPDGLALKKIANGTLNFGEDNFNLENGMIMWYSDDAENVSNDLLADVTITVPANTPEGEYEIEFEIIDISRDWGMPWENGKVLTAALTVGAHADGDDADHLCDYCDGAVEGENCAKYLSLVTGQPVSCTEAGWQDYYQCSCGKLYSDSEATTEITDLDAWKAEGGDGYIAATGEHVYVPGEYTWSDDYSTCTVVGTCACGETETATANSTYEVTTIGTCQTEEVVTYYADFAETWAEDQSEPVTGETNPDNHAGEQTTDYENNGDDHTVIVTCECGEEVSTESEGHTYTDGKCVCGAEEPSELDPSEPVAGLKGDVNLDGVVDMQDLVAMAQHLGEITEITDAQSLANADVLTDGVVDMQDLVKLAQYLGEIINSLE